MILKKHEVKKEEFLKLSEDEQQEIRRTLGEQVAKNIIMSNSSLIGQSKRVSLAPPF